jgi:hypothetical protein
MPGFSSCSQVQSRCLLAHSPRAPFPSHADQLHVTYNPTCEPAQVLSVFNTPYPNLNFYPYAEVGCCCHHRCGACPSHAGPGTPTCGEAGLRRTSR